MLIDGENEVYFVDRDNCVFQVSNLRFPKRKKPKEHISDTLLDGVSSFINILLKFVIFLCHVMIVWLSPFCLGIFFENILYFSIVFL